MMDGSVETGLRINGKVNKEDMLRLPFVVLECLKERDIHTKCKELGCRFVCEGRKERRSEDVSQSTIPRPGSVVEEDHTVVNLTR